MNDINELLAEARDDVKAALAYEQLLAETAAFLAGATSLGYTPRLDASNMLVLTVDLDAWGAPAGGVPVVADPEPQPEPQPAPVANEPAPPVAPAVDEPEDPPAEVGGWTGEQDAQMLKMRAAGATTRDIGEKVGRPWQAVVARLKVLDQERAEQPQADVPASRFGRIKLTTASLMPREQRVEMILQAVGYPEPWTPAMDLRMVEGLARGDGTNGVAEALDIAKAIVVARYRALLPDSDVSNQAALLKVLRLRAAMAEARTQAAE